MYSHLFIFFKAFYFHIYLFVHGVRCWYVGIYEVEVRGQFISWELILSFHHVVPGDWILLGFETSAFIHSTISPVYVCLYKSEPGNETAELPLQCSPLLLLCLFFVSSYSMFFFSIFNSPRLPSFLDFTARDSVEMISRSGNEWERSLPFICSVSIGTQKSNSLKFI